MGLDQSLALRTRIFTFGLFRFAKYLVGGDLLFDGGMVLTYADKKT